MFDVLLHEMRTHSSEWLERRRAELVDEQRALRSEEMAIIRVLDERGRGDVSLGSDGESARTVRDKVETARRLEVLPAIAAAAHDGLLSDEQLRHVTQLADEDTDAEWAARAPDIDPGELARRARCASKPSAETQRARHQARSLRMWRSHDQKMLHLHGVLPDVMGARFELTIRALTEQMKPAKGEVFDSLEHRAADALVSLCERVQPTGDQTPTLAAQPQLQVLVPETGPAEIAGIPLADTLLEQLRANAIIEPVLIDPAGVRVAVGRAVSAISPKIRRAVLLRDGRCRMPGCETRTGLEIHHLAPRSRGGTDDIANLACVCPPHHRRLVPHGTLTLIGNPNQPDGLRLVDAPDRAPP